MFLKLFLSEGIKIRLLTFLDFILCANMVSALIPEDFPCNVIVYFQTGKHDDTHLISILCNTHLRVKLSS